MLRKEKLKVTIVLNVKFFFVSLLTLWKGCKDAVKLWTFAILWVTVYCWHSRNPFNSVNRLLIKDSSLCESGIYQSPIFHIRPNGRLWKTSAFARFLLWMWCFEKKKNKLKKKNMKNFRVKQKSREIRNKVFNHCFVQICVWSFFCAYYT